MTENKAVKSFSTTEKKSKTLIPYAMLCELTHRCPLACPYCSNPVQLEMLQNYVSSPQKVRSEPSAFQGTHTMWSSFGKHQNLQINSHLLSLILNLK